MHVCICVLRKDAMGLKHKEKATKFKCLQHFFDTQSLKGTKFFCFTQSSQRSKDAKGERIETQSHEGSKSRSFL